MEWTFKDSPLTDHNYFYGFVYLITNLITGKKYIGRKYFWKRNKGKYSESDWREYYGSSKFLNEDILKYGKENFKREILSLHKNRKAVNYSELETIIKHNAIFDDNYYNKSLDYKTFNINLTESQYA